MSEAILVCIARVHIGALCKYTTPQPCLFRRSVANACSLASLRALFLMVGTLPSRTLVQMSPHDNTLPSEPKSADSFQLACILPTDFFGAAVQKPRRLRRNFLSVVWSKTVFAQCHVVKLLQIIL